MNNLLVEAAREDPNMFWVDGDTKLTRPRDEIIGVDVKAFVAGRHNAMQAVKQNIGAAAICILWKQ